MHKVFPVNIVKERYITKKRGKGEQSSLHATYHLDLIYNRAKYYQNISKGRKIIEDTSFCLTDGCQAPRL